MMWSHLPVCTGTMLAGTKYRFTLLAGVVVFYETAHPRISLSVRVSPSRQTSEFLKSKVDLTGPES